MILRLAHWISRKGRVQQSTFGTVIDKWEFYFYNPALFFLINQLLIIDKGLIIPFPAASKKEKNKYCRLMHMQNLEKLYRWTYFHGRNRDTGIENGHVGTGWGGEGGTSWGIKINIYTLPCIKGLYSQSYGFSSSHVWMSEMGYKEGWVLQNWCFWTVLLEKTLESPLDFKEIQPVHPKGNQPWISTGRTDAEAEALVLWPPDVKSWLTGKDPNSGKDWRQEKGTTEDEMVGWHHQLNGYEFE